MPMLLVILALAAVFCVGIALWWQARLLLRPPRMTAGKAKYILNRIDPADIDIPFEPIAFKVKHDADATLTIASWWMPTQGSTRTVVLIHGYADAKVGSIAFAPLFREMGFNILAVDLRAHGNSGGNFITAGRLESLDLEQVIHQLCAMHPSATQSLVLFGLSYGCAVAVQVAIKVPDIAGIICESPFAHLSRACAVHTSRLTLPLPSMQNHVMRLAQWMCESDFEALSPVTASAKLRQPVLVLLGENDAFLNEGSRELLEDAIKARNNPRDRIHSFEGAAHLMNFTQHPQKYREVVQAFVESL
jgi:uncharacterized protein